SLLKLLMRIPYFLAMFRVWWTRCHRWHHHRLDKQPCHPTIWMSFSQLLILLGINVPETPKTMPSSMKAWFYFDTSSLAQCKCLDREIEHVGHLFIPFPLFFLCDLCAFSTSTLCSYNTY